MPSSPAAARSPLWQPSRLELLAQLLVSLGQRGNDKWVLREIHHPASPRLEVAECELIRIMLPLRPGAVRPDHGRRRDLDRIRQIDPADSAQAVSDHVALGGQLGVIPQVLKIRTATGEEGICLCDAIGTRFEDVDDRCVSNAAMLAVDADTQSIAWGGACDDPRSRARIRLERCAQ